MAEITDKTTAAATPQSGTVPAQSSSKKRPAPGLAFKRYFTKAGVSPYDEVEWEFRTAQITDAQGGVIFEQQNVEIPKDWSMTATGAILQVRRRCGHFPRRAGAPAHPAEGRLQLARVVQRGLRPHRAQLRRPELALERG